MEQATQTRTGQRLAQRVFLSRLPLPEKLARATETWTRLQMDYPETEARLYLEKLADFAPHLTLLLLPRLRGRNPLSEEQMQKVHAIMTASCAAKLDKRSAAPASDPAERPHYVRAFLSKTALHTPPALPKELARLTQDTAAALLLEDDELIDRALKLVQRTVESFGALPAGLTELTVDEDKLPLAGEELDQWTCQQMVSRMIGCFAERTLEILRLGFEPLEGIFRFYRHCYQTLPREWNSNIAYNLYGAVTPLEGPPPAELVALIRQAVQDHELLYAYLMLKFYVPVHLSQLGYTLPEFMALIFAAPDGANLYRGLLLAEKLAVLDAPTEIEGIEQWWAALCAAVPAESDAWRERGTWFRMYHLCRCITACPERAAEFLTGEEPLPPEGLVLKRSTAVQEAAMEALCGVPDQSILRLLEVLGEHNVFRFNAQEETYPFLDRRALRGTPDEAVGGLLRQGFRAEQLVRIYMNTYLRCQITPGYFLKLLIRGGVYLGFADRRSRMVISDLFMPYGMLGDMRQSPDGKFGLMPHNFRTPRSSWLLPMTSNWQQMSDLCQELMERGEPLPFHLVHFTPIDGSVYASLDPQAWMDEQGKRSFQTLCAELETIARTGRFAEEENQRIGKLPVLSLPQRSDAEKLTLGLLMVRCCAALSYNYMAVRYFLNKLNILHNPFRFYTPGTHKRTVGPVKVDPAIVSDDQRALLHEQWDRIMSSDLTMEQTFFIYINTIAHLCIPLSDWADRYAEGSQRLNLLPMMTAPTRYRFTGRIRNIQPDRNPDLNYIYIRVTPDDLYYGESEEAWGRPFQYMDRFIFRTKGNADQFWPGQYCTFLIGSYDPARRSFSLDQLTPYGNEDTEGLNKPFFTALSRAANRIDLSEQDIADLRSPPGTLNAQTVTRAMGLVANALRRRQESLPAINRYLEALGPNNFWRFGDTLPPCKKHPHRNVVSSLSYTLRSAARGYSHLSSPLELYFNTPMRACLSLNRAMTILQEEGHDLSALATYMQDYALLVRCTDDGLTPVNFVGEHLQMELPAGHGDMVSCLLERYDPETDSLYLKPRR